MVRRLAVIVVGLVLIALSPTASAHPTKIGRYVVVLNDNVPAAEAVAAEHATLFGANVTHVYETALKGYAAALPTTALGVVEADPRVDFVSVDREYRVAAQTLPTGINRIEGDLSSAASGNGSGTSNVKVAVIDTGISRTHPDLNVAGGKNCVPVALSYEDDHGHGSHVAGTMAGKDNGVGVVGMAPGAGVYGVKVLAGVGTGLGSWIICGIDWVAANGPALGIKVANMSLGGSGTDDGNCGKTNNDAEHKAICNATAKGVTFVVAAGNDNADIKNSAPAAYDEVLTVASMADFNGAPGGGASPTCRADVDDKWSSFSNWTTIGHPDANHTIAAPGTCIYSTASSGGYTTMSGTSMASPHVAGTVAQCFASGACAGLSPGQVIAKMRADAAAAPASYGFTGDPRSPSANRYYGYLATAAGY